VVFGPLGAGSFGARSGTSYFTAMVSVRLGRADDSEFAAVCPWGPAQAVDMVRSAMTIQSPRAGLGRLTLATKVAAHGHLFRNRGQLDRDQGRSPVPHLLHRLSERGTKLF